MGPSLKSLDPLASTMHAKEPSFFYTRVIELQRLEEYCTPTTHESFFAFNVLAWVAILTSQRLCGYLEVLSTLHSVLEAWLVFTSSILFLWKNFGFYYSTDPRRKALKPTQQSGVFDPVPRVHEILLVTITLFPVVIGPLNLLPIGVVLVLGDVLTSGFLAWMKVRLPTGPIRAGSTQVHEDTATSGASLSLQWRETGDLKIHAVALQFPCPTESGKLKTPRPAANASQTPSATAIHSKMLGPVEIFVDGASLILLSSPQALSILTMMLNPRNSEPLCFDEELIPILRDFGRNLAAKEEKGALAAAAATLQSEQGSIVIAGETLRLVRRLWSEASGGCLLSSQQQGLDGHELSTGAQGQLDERAAVSESCIKSYAQLTFEWDLIHCARRSYEDRLRSIMAGAALLGHSGTELSPSKSLAIVRELSWVPPYLVSIFTHASLSRSEDIKSFVELKMGEAWNWWPLSPASRGLQAGYHRLEWKSPLGEVRYVDFTDNISAALQSAIQTAPKFLNIGLPLNTKASLPTGGTTATSSSGSGKLPLTHSPPHASSPTHLARPLPTRQSNVPSPLASQNTPMAAQGAANSISIGRHLSLCLTTSSHKFVSIRCDILRTDLEFYTRMKHVYNRARGWLRLYFSMWQYDHCEFVRFKKYGFHRGARLKVDFPEQDDFDYDFVPRVPSPAPPDGPVSSDEFRDHYYLPDCPSFQSWRRYQLRLRGHFSRVAREDLEAVPKRHTEVNMDDGLSELFYGLYAKERRSFARVAMYACLCNLPGIIFFFLWLFRSGHGADLQNASVPLTLSLSLTLGFAAVVFGTRDGV